MFSSRLKSIKDTQTFFCRRWLRLLPLWAVQSNLWANSNHPKSICLLEQLTELTGLLQQVICTFAAKRIRDCQRRPKSLRPAKSITILTIMSFFHSGYTSNPILSNSTLPTQFSAPNHSHLHWVLVFTTSRVQSALSVYNKNFASMLVAATSP